MAHYIHDDKNNRIEGMSKEEIYALLAEAIQEGELPQVDQDTAFVTMIKSIVDGKAYKMGFCTEAQYNQLKAEGELVEDAYYIIIDDTTYDDLINVIEQLQTDIETDIESKLELINNKITEIESDINELNTAVNAISTNSTLSATASTTTANCTFSITSVVKNVIAKVGSIVFVEYDITTDLELDAGFAASATAYGNVNLTIPSGYRPSIAIPLSLTHSETGDMTNKNVTVSNLNPNGSMTITCAGSYSNAYVASAEFTIRLFGTYTTL